tara:strand:+ start:226 stop:513 length:288 start_codon:yes stop_codon:yes gene_type:complete
VADQEITYPTDLKPLSTSRVDGEQCLQASMPINPDAGVASCFHLFDGIWREGQGQSSGPEKTYAELRINVSSMQGNLQGSKTRRQEALLSISIPP